MQVNDINDDDEIVGWCTQRSMNVGFILYCADAGPSSNLLSRLVVLAVLQAKVPYINREIGTFIMKTWMLFTQRVFLSGQTVLRI
jgi:hypothetical protein